MLYDSATRWGSACVVSRKECTAKSTWMAARTFFGDRDGFFFSAVRQMQRRGAGGYRDRPVIS